MFRKQKEGKDMTWLRNHRLIDIVREWDTWSSLRGCECYTKGLGPYWGPNRVPLGLCTESELLGILPLEKSV